MSRFYLCFLILLITASVQGQRIRVNENETALGKFPNVVQVEFQKIISYLHSEPREMHLKNGFIICHNTRTPEDGYWIIILTKNGELVDKKFKRGRGPNEVLQAGSSGLINNKFWIFDRGLGRIWFTNDFLEKESDLTSNTVDLKVLQVRYVDDASVITFGSTGTNNKYDIYDFNANMILRGLGNLNTLSRLIDVNTSANEEWSPQPEKLFFEGDYKVKPDRTKFVAGCYWFDVIEIYNITGELIKAIRGPLNLNPNFKIFRNNDYAGVDRPPHTRIGYTYISCSDKYIYAGFSGKRIMENSPFHFEKIYVFNWEGESIAILNLNHSIRSFVVDEEEKSIYAVSGQSGDLIKASFIIEDAPEAAIGCSGGSFCWGC
ncbi:BF3164 family lipoprotein [Alkalitalea saponilacus]|uniref:TolB-like 6-blade propeller-like n=1 Tax=Alkalitalea saponilacus TaxID=889453 RepID=A0A1T5HMS3_9BACT|nr:BF3164 family lipoprotein [Alkalitalea saponilacus]ASB49379.1 hypothetical protein CDL62_09620 [Alkalitalea saponilacus]SKC21984.1 TolB-like 6-blade propeller-like [Alkalitalea saponilacus]